MSVDWSKAPEEADFYANGKFWRATNVGLGYSCETKWIRSAASYDMLKSFWDFEQRPIELEIKWPEETRIDNIGRNRTEDDMGHYDELREVQEKMAAREAHLKQSAEQNRAPDSLGKYDRRIKGKHNTGTCTVDVYRVLSAFEITEPELQHCIKKLLAAGQRGAKDYQQDLREASVSLCMLISRLEEEEINLK